MGKGGRGVQALSNPWRGESLPWLTYKRPDWWTAELVSQSKSRDWSNGVAVACESMTVLGESLVGLVGSLMASC